MPLPLLWIGAGLVGAALTAEHAKAEANKREQQRLHHDEPLPHDDDKNGSVKMPSEILTSDFTAKLMPGTIVSCSVFNAFDHIGIWLEPDIIVELHGTGLIKAVSHARFLNNRSGNTLFAACDSKGQVLVVPQTLQRATKEIFNYWSYDVRKNNCYRFSWYCITGESKVISSFTQFNDQLAKYHKKKIYWDKVSFT